MPIVINGSGSITGVSTGGLPDGIVDADMLATSAVTSAKILDATIASGDLASGAITSGAMPAGSVLQVLQYTMTSDVGCTVTSWQGTGLQVNITPSSTSSKILVTSAFGTESGTSGNLGYYTLYRDDTTNLGDGTYGFGLESATGISRGGFSIVYLDSPNTTSAVNYEVYQKSGDGSNIKIGGGAARTTIIAMEIKG